MEGRASLIIIMKVRSGRRAAPSDAVCSEDRSEDNVDVFALPKVQMKIRFFRGFSGKEAYESHSKGNCWMVGYCKESTGRSERPVLSSSAALAFRRPSEGHPAAQCLPSRHFFLLQYRLQTQTLPLQTDRPCGLG